MSDFRAYNSKRKWDLQYVALPVESLNDQLARIGTIKGIDDCRNKIG